MSQTTDELDLTIDLRAIFNRMEREAIITALNNLAEAIMADVPDDLPTIANTISVAKVVRCLERAKGQL